MKKNLYLSIFLFFFPFWQLSCAENDHTTLLIKIPTRSRYERFFSTLDQYYQKLSNKFSYHFVISCDSDDPVMNSEHVIERLKSYPNLSFYFAPGQSKIEAVNRDIERHLDFDILLLGSDDMVPVVNGYDEIIVSSMLQFFPDTDGVLHFNDGAVGYQLNTLSIMGKKYYDRFGYIYYPGYISVYCDNEFTDISRFLNKAVYFDTVIIEHRHFVWGKSAVDALYQRNEQSTYYHHDGQLWETRRQSNYGLIL